MPETLLLKSDLENAHLWKSGFAGFDLNVVSHDEEWAPEDIDYALVWKPRPGMLAALPNLKVVFSIGAGLDHLKGDNLVPAGVPVVRMVEDALTSGMVEYVVYHTLRFHRFMPRYEQDQRERVWQERVAVPAWERRVGILGLGVLGGAAATALVSLGFRVSGWSRTAKEVEGVTSYHGDDQLAAFLADTEILVCLLPLTPATAGILGAANFDRLPRGASIINAGRGGHCNEQELIDALDSGQLGGAALDVFQVEPLPADSPLWDHPAVYITPHVASMTLPTSSARHVIENIRRLRAGEPLTHVGNLERGY